MIFRVTHPDFPQYGFKLLQVSWELEEKINRLGPVKLVSGSYDWPNPNHNESFRGWTDKLNSLWWVDEADNFATCVLLLDDSRNDLLSQLVEAQPTSLDCWHIPYVILSARLQPNRGEVTGKPGTYAYPAESFIPGGQVTGVSVETPLVEWKMYPLQTVNLTSLTSDEAFRGLWLLPLVCIRYFYRNVPLNPYVRGSSSSSCGTEPGYPIIEINRDSVANWMPELKAYPKDLSGPANYVPIIGNGTWPAINGSMRWGTAGVLQSRMENWRIVCRDVRSEFSIPGGGANPHNEFTGVVADYPEDWSLADPQSYHIDACNFLLQPKSRLAGGDCDTRILDELTSRKLQVLFNVKGTEAFYSVTIAATVDYPTTQAHLTEDVNGPSPDEAKVIPSVNLGVQASSRNPDSVEHDQLVTAAKTWALSYYAWRHKQAYMVFPGIYPVIPNGHSKVIRWDFGGDINTWRTTYIALEGVQGTEEPYQVVRTPFYARIDGEGAIQDGLHGFYAYTELLDSNGELTTHPDPRIGYVRGVNGQTESYNPARDEAGKVAVPVGLVVWLKPGVPYLDVTTHKIFDHYLFTTTDLLQVVRLKQPLEVNSFGHLGAVIQRFNPDTKTLVDSKDIWVLVLR